MAAKVNIQYLLRSVRNNQSLFFQYVFADGGLKVFLNPGISPFDKLRDR